MTVWRRSTRCDSGACLEWAWTRSGRCQGGNCVEAAHRGQVLVRDSKLGDQSPILRFEPAAWQAFVADLRTGRIGGQQ